jgi:hypothetical protein
MFERFPSLTRFSQGWSISEKIDGTNAQVFIANLIDPNINHAQSVARVGDLYIFAGSRSRLITPDNDNHGFARWVRDNAEMLVSTLGEGRHFGEWWGRGIQRGYGLDEKRFSLFNTLRWKQEDLPEGLYVVFELKEKGSLAAPGFMDPEGIVMFHRASGVAFKKTFDYDEFGKWMENQERKQNG